MLIEQANAVLRILLELAAFIAAGYWGYGLAEGLWAGTLALLIPLGMALFWGIFAVPNDPTLAAIRVPVPVPGWLRLLIEFLFFGFGIWCLIAVGELLWAWVFGTALLMHYGLAFPRVTWLLRKRSS